MSTDESAVPTAEDEAPDVFISYARKDRQIVLRLASALEAGEWRVWVDTEDIPPTADWSEELAVGIRTAHTFIFVISPRSVRSEYCLHELDQALELGKRLVPVVVEDAGAVPEALAARQYIYLRGKDDFDASLQTLTTALGTDLEWVREHRQWLTAALRWDASGRDRSMLIRGRDLKSAEAWLARQAERTEPRPTRVQTEFLIASRSWQTRRLQAIVAGVAIALAVAVLLGILALLQRNAARKAAAIARSRELAIASTSKLSVDPELSLILAIEAVRARQTAEADNSLRTAVAASRLRAEIPVHGEAVRSLITDVAFSPDGSTIAVALADGTIHLADLGNGRHARVVSLPVSTMSAGDLCTTFRNQGQTRIAFSSDGRWIAAAGDKSLIELWRLPNPHTVISSRFCLGQTASPSAAALGTAALGTGFGTVALTFAGDTTVEAMEENGRLIRWRWTHAKPQVERVSASRVWAAAFAGRNGRTVAFADAKTISEWASGRRVFTPGNIQGAYDVAVSADGSRLVVALGHSVDVWSVGAATPVALTSPKIVRSLAITRDGRFVAAGDDAGTVRVWSVAHPGLPVVLLGSSGAVTAVAFSESGRRVLSGGDDGVLRVWKWESRTPIPFGGQAPRPERLSLTQDGRLVELDSKIPRRAWTRIGRRLRYLDDVVGPARLSFDRNGLRAAGAPGTAPAIQLWDLSGSSHSRVIAVDRRVNAAALSPDGRWIASGESDRLRLLRWPGSRALVLEQAQISAGKFVEYNAAAFSKDSRRLATAGYNGKTSTVNVWQLSQADAGSGAIYEPGRLLRLEAPGFVSALAFSPDGKKLLAAMAEGPVRVWNLDDGSVIVLRGHSGAADDAAFSPGGSEVISGGGDGTVRVWELGEAGKAVAIPGQVGIVTGVAFARDGTEIDAVGMKGARRWSCDFCGPILGVLARAQAMTTRSLSPDERALYLHQH